MNFNDLVDALSFLCHFSLILFGILALLTNSCFCCWIFPDFEDFANFTLSSRGQLKLIHKHFDCNKSGVAHKTQTTSWRCATAYTYPYIRFKAKALTKEINGTHMVKSIEKHTHPALSNEKMARMKLKIRNSWTVGSGRDQINLST